MTIVQFWQGLVLQEEATTLYCGWFEGFHIAIHCIVLQENQCIAIGS